jgi:plasmid replication initiation protein
MGEFRNLEQIKDFQNYPVIKSNKLIEAKYKLNLNEIRLVYVVISKIKPQDEEFKRHSLKVQDLLKMFEITTNDYHLSIKKILEDLSHKSITIEDKSEKNRFLVANWFASAEYIGKEGIVEIELSTKLKPYLLQGSYWISGS